MRSLFPHSQCTQHNIYLYLSIYLSIPLSIYVQAPTHAHTCQRRRSEGRKRRNKNPQKPTQPHNRHTKREERTPQCSTQRIHSHATHTYVKASELEKETPHSPHTENTKYATKSKFIVQSSAAERDTRSTSSLTLHHRFDFLILIHILAALMHRDIQETEDFSCSTVTF